MLNSSAKERLWVVARRDLSDCIFLLQKKDATNFFLPHSGRSTADTKRSEAIKVDDRFLMIAFWKWFERSIYADLLG
jgi:hypothetical protein